MTKRVGFYKIKEKDKGRNVLKRAEGARYALILLALGILLFAACDRIQSTEFYTVSGYVETDAGYDDISVYVNDVESDFKIAADGSFSFGNLKPGDVVSFRLKGYEFNSYTVYRSSVDGVQICGTRKKIFINIRYDKEKGRVSGGGQYEYGDEVVLTFYPGEGCEYKGLYEDGVLVSDGETEVFTAESSKEYTAEFAPKTHEVRIVDGRYPLSEGEIIKATHGERINLRAEDDENFVFAYWKINGEKTLGNDIGFIVNDDAVIEKVFLKRLEKPTIVKYGNEIRVSLPEGAEEYDVIIDGNAGGFYLCEEEGDVSLDLKKSSVTSGRHEIAVVVRGKDSGENVGTLAFDYERPPDAPKRAGILVGETEIFFVFSAVPAAKSYDVEINGERKSLSDFEYVVTAEEISVRVDCVFDLPGNYRFRAFAKGDGTESDPSDAAYYEYFGQIDAPGVKAEGYTLILTHPIADAQLRVEINGVTVYAGTSGRVDLKKYITEEEAEIRVIASADGMKSAQTTVRIKFTDKGEENQ